MFPTVSCFSFPSEFRINSNFPPWKQCKHFTLMDYNEVGLIDVCAHLDFYEVVWTSSQGLPLDWTKRWISHPPPQVWKIIPKLYLLEGHAQSHTFRASDFAAWNFSWGLHLALMTEYHESSSIPKPRNVNVLSMLLNICLYYHVLSLQKPQRKQWEINGDRKE